MRPSLRTKGPRARRPQLKTIRPRHVRSASSYDWSNSQAAEVTSTTAQWQQDIAGSDTPGRAAVGVDHAAQTSDGIKTFIAGALLGIAGGAIIAAVQEAMHLGRRPEPSA